MDQLFPEATEALKHAAVEGYRQHYLQPQNRRVTLFAGVNELLDQLESAGFLLAVATGKSRRGLDRALAESGLAGRFVVTRTVDECHSKPHPQILLDIADLTGVAPAQMIMVGDGVMDMQMATNAGVAALAVSSGAGAQQELLAEGAMGCMESVCKLEFLAGSGA